MDQKKEKSLKKAYDTFMELMLYDFPVDRIHDIIDEHVTGYGTTKDERILDITGLRKLVVDQRTQGAGIEFQYEINPVHRLIMAGENTAQFVDEVTIIMMVDGNTNKIPLRLSTLFEFKETTWKVVHIHGSVAVETEEDTWHLNEWQQKNAELQKLVDEKTAELTKQNRELEIETALERVRTRTMAMQKSEELKEVIQIVYEQLVHLKINLDHAGFVVDYKPKADWHFWIADKQEIPSKITHPYFESIWANQFNEAKEKGLDFFTTNLNFDEKNKFYQELFKYVPELSEESREFYFNCPGLAASNVLMENVALYIENFSAIPYKDEENSVVKRFGKVFEQTYTRFLDLQKAEAQAREAQIEASLERVRSRSMAMHKSDELSQVVALIYEEIKNLGFTDWGCSIIICDKKAKVMRYWYAETNVPHLEGYCNVPLTNKIVKKAWKLWQSGIPQFDINLLGKEKEDYTSFMLNDTDYSIILSEEVKKGWRKPKDIFLSYFALKYGMLEFVDIKPLNPENYQVYQRFTKVFEQTYTRFLDLQKAEAQAFEAQIEAALERVRAQTMAMHNSNDMGNCILKMFDELTALGVDERTRFGIGILNHDNENNQLWTARKEGEEVKMHIGNLDMNLHPLLKSARKAWKEQVNLHEYVLEGDDLLKYYQMINNARDYKLRVLTEKLPEREFHYGFIFSHGFFYAFSPTEFQPDLIHIAQRFRALFEQTYTRFLDLQKAEAQAREAQIEAALERVRSRSMAMHNSNDLHEVIKVVNSQMAELGIKFDTVNFHKVNPDGSWEMWIATTSQAYPSLVHIPYLDHPMFNHEIKTRQDGLNFFVDTCSHEEKNIFFNHFFNSPILENIPIERKEFVLKSKGHARSVFRLKNINLSIANYDAVPYSEEDNALFKRFAIVFEQAYTRFLDLQKAEAQAREAQIEAALERVRSRSLAMHKAEELGEVAAVVFEKLRELDMPVNDGVAIVTHIEGSKDQIEWMESPDHPSALKVYQPYYEHPILADYWKAKNKGLDFIAPKYTAEQSRSFFKHIFEFTDYKHTPQEIKDYCLAAETYSYFAAFQKNSSIFINDFSERALSTKEIDIVKRFSKVFEQAYVRFLDLQKAEAQAREAQIETGLERVRAQAMAMHHSDDLGITIEMFYEQLSTLLATPVIRCGAGILNKENSMAEIATASKNEKGEIFHVKGNIDMTGHPLLQNTIDHWLDQKEYYHVLRGAEIKKYYQYMTNQVAILDYSEDEAQHFYFPMFSEGSFYVITKSELCEEELRVVRRFSSVLSLTYRRFNDLKKAEAQAREAQIEAALEKVRSRTMAMQRSGELAEAATLLFQQVKALGIPQWTCGFCIFEIDDKEFTWYPGGPDGEILQPSKIPLLEHSIFRQFNESRKRGDELYIYEKSGEVQEDHYRYMLSLPVVGEYLQSRLDAGEEFPKYQIDHLANFAYGNLIFITYEHFPEMHDVFRRFAKVFEQTYTRFLDLQKAEAQAREAQIEAALERIRTKALAMQSSADLHGVSIVLREQMGLLGQPELESSIVHLYNSSETLESWYTFRSTETGSQKTVTDVAVIPVDSCAYIRETLEKYSSNEPEYTIVSEGKKLVEWYHVMENVAPDTIEYDAKGKMIVPKRLYYHHSKFSGGALLMISVEKPSDEAKELQKRAAKVFNLAYQRFLDLQQAEKRAKESLKQASLDRVRGEIASMRSKEDLTRITPLIWHELTVLGVPFIRCGVFIMDNDNSVIQSFLSTPEGKSLGMYHLPYHTTEIAVKMVTRWKKGKAYNEHWDKEQFENFINAMAKRGLIQNQQTYRGDAPPEALDLHFVPFKQGMLYAGNTTPLSEEALLLLKSLAEAFSIAYARYEDFTQLEAAKKQTEKTLSELKSAQSQLIQAEKMASLGELTAGIAHEIQNPLNFVNNFSEVSEELLTELNEELIKGDLEEAKLISSDVIKNLQKIHHHGQRASGIVKGMLEHSRTGSREKQLTDINALVDEYLRLSYHGLRAKDKSFNAEFKMESDPSLPKIMVIGQDIGRVLLNLINNAFYAVSEKAKKGIAGYAPAVMVKTKKVDHLIEIRVKDNADGIPPDIVNKIFQPFFTTKPTGSGTGLGLSLSYDIVTMGHNGTLEVDTNEGLGSEFIVQLPINV